MSKFQTFDVDELLGLAPVRRITDEEIWQHLVTPMTKGLLGPIVRSDPPRVMETVEGMFPHDGVTNLNDHRLYGGASGFVRNRYIYSFYKTLHGALVVKRDSMKVEVMCWSGDVEKGRGELILKAGMRDRRYDGTKRANDCALLEFPYDDPVHHKPMSAELTSVELSVYAFMPGSRVEEVTGEPEYEEFFQNPYKFLDRPELFLTYFHRAWNSRRAPGQVAAPIIDVSKLILPAFERLVKVQGYDLLEAAPSHYHVARYFLAEGYLFASSEQEKNFLAFTEGLERIRAGGVPLTRSQQSWVCVVQSLPKELIPNGLNLDGPVWPQDNIGTRCLWLYKPISDKARAFMAEKLASQASPKL